VSWLLAAVGAAAGLVAGWLLGRRGRPATSGEPPAAPSQQDQDRFTAVLGATRTGVIALDGQDRVLEVNERAQDLLPFNADPVGRLLEDVLDLSEVTELVGQAGPEPRAEVTLVGPPPRVLSARVARPSDGGQIVLLHDITARRHVEGIKRDFVANASHELRTPVTVIRANAETLLDGALDEPDMACQFVEGIHRNATRLSDLLSDMLDLSRLEAGRFVLEPRVLRVHPMLEQVAANVQERAADKGVTVTLDCPEELEGFADARALDQVLTNLVENAAKYTPSGGRVTLRARPAAHGVRLEVEDDGPGIPPEHRARVFERFYRVDTGRSRALGGTGLGLAIVRLLVNAMGGRVGLEPVEPHGALFWVELPP